jgi:hypothetical protein
LANWDLLKNLGQTLTLTLTLKLIPILILALGIIDPGAACEFREGAAFVL